MKLNLRRSYSFWVIALVFLATLYNIFPSLIYYSKPLNKPLSLAHQDKIIVEQIKRLEKAQHTKLDFVKTVCKNLKITPVDLKVSELQPQLARLTFKKAEDKSTFEKYFPAAQSLNPRTTRGMFLIPGSHPVQAEVVVGSPWSANDLKKTVPSHRVNKKAQVDIPADMNTNWQTQALFLLHKDLFSYGPDLHALIGLESTQWNVKQLLATAELLIALNSKLEKDQLAAKRVAKTVVELINDDDLKQLTNRWQGFIDQSKTAASEKNVASLSNEELKTLESALISLKKLSHLKQKKDSSLTYEHLTSFVSNQLPLSSDNETLQWTALPFSHPLVEAIAFNAQKQTLQFKLYQDLNLLLNASLGSSPSSTSTSKAPLHSHEPLLNQLYSLISHFEENNLGTSTFNQLGFELQLNNHLAKNFIFWDLQLLLQQEHEALKDLLMLWNPLHPSFSPSQFKIFSSEEFLKPSSTPEDKLFCLIIDSKGTFASFAQDKNKPQVLFKGLNLLVNLADKSNQKEQFDLDLERLLALLSSRGYTFTGALKNPHPNLIGATVFSSDSIFTKTLNNTDFKWKILGQSPQALLSIQNYSDWLKQINQIEDEDHKELIRSYEDWRAASLDANPLRQILTIKPAKNLLLENFKLSLRKIWRGDSQKSLKWGLDLSGGKTVRLELYDTHAKLIKDVELLTQARNELIQRVNRMGLAEVVARIEGHYLVLDFPSSQNYSSKELIQSSSMSFHVVNERFSFPQSPQREDVENFLQQVWSEAVALRKTDLASLNAIASQLLSDSLTTSSLKSAKNLVEAGLKILPLDQQASHELNDQISMIAPLKAYEDEAVRPLMIVFRNWALKGSDLDKVKASYDPQHGHILTFDVKAQSKDNEQPQESFWQWTSKYCEENLNQSNLNSITAGRGWRMAVMLNDQIVSSPSLNSGLRDHAMIFGQFSQKDVLKLANDLQAGSLTFTPKILSEENISPELGYKDRTQGMFASAVALAAVIICMCFYYHFAGLIASVAVLFNLLILWAVLQYLGAALTLPGLAGIVLTVGMAVDANVLVFERIREELQSGSQLMPAIQAGYKRALSAIADSNLTTILAAFILVQFDSGPIKGFAITLIIGITSSMFTALFVTRTFFETWAQKPSRALKLKDWIGRPKIFFLKYSQAFITAGLIFSLSGMSLLYMQRHEIFGMDFVGGYAFTIKLDNESQKEQLVKSLVKADIHHDAFNIRQVGEQGTWRVYLSRSLDNPGAVFARLPSENERLDWVKNHLQHELSLDEQALQKLETSWTSVSGQLSSTMRSQALLGIGLALLGILIYLAFRFEWHYAVAAVTALGFDVLVSLAAIAWLRLAGLPMQIDLQAIGAIMTIVGYALNDKIIVFDRIREQKGEQVIDRKLIQYALQSTLSRTLMTSCTTLIVLVVLDLMGGQSLFSFSMIMTVGVAIGTLSSLFAAPAILLLTARRKI